MTATARRILKPTLEGDDSAAKREAMLKPKVLGEFLRRYDNQQVPRDDIARNVLGTLGVPSNRTAEVLKLILDGAEAVGFVRKIKDKRFIDLQGTTPVISAEEPAGDDTEEIVSPDEKPGAPAAKPKQLEPAQFDERSKRVFITHGKNKLFIEPIKELLTFGQWEAVVATEKQTVSQPVPQKVMEDMRACGAAIIHVEGERKLMEVDTTRELMALNENVLIEIGAAMALYGERFILVVKEGITLPSNLQGLYEVRYKGDALDGNEAIKLLKAINDIGKRPLPKTSQ